MRTLVLLSAVLALAAGLNCYVGSAGNVIPLPCSSTCMKKKFVDANGIKTISYSCGDIVCNTMSISNGTCKAQKGDGYSKITCCCSGDLCNSSGLAQISTVVVLMLSALVIL